jgi:hypothetical protein
VKNPFITSKTILKQNALRFLKKEKESYPFTRDSIQMDGPRQSSYSASPMPDSGKGAGCQTHPSES